MFQYVLQTAVHNVHDKIILECDWLSPAKSTNRTVCALGLLLDCVVEQLQGQLTCHAWVNGQ